MSESLTGGATQTPASNEPTGQVEQQQPTAESQNQETVSREQSNQSSERLRS